jgi:glycosyltransferase involved in cell wall biosynthesis
LYRTGVRAWVKSPNTKLAKPVLWMLRRSGNRVRPSEAAHSKVLVFSARHPENAYRSLVDRQRPDAVVVNSVSRAAWRWIHDDLRRLQIASVLYVREAHALTHLTVSGVAPDLLVANAAAHARALEEAGHPAHLVPSVVDRSAAAVESTRSTALLVNPIAENHIDVVLRMARLRPDIPFVLQESWPLDASYLADLRSNLSGLPNVEFRARVAQPSDVYHDAKVLLATYPTNRPRVIAEAQHNGIPVLALDLPALNEAVGPGGRFVRNDASPEEWTAALAALWDDPATYERFSIAARTHDRRPEMDPDLLARLFAQAVERVIE